MEQTHIKLVVELDVYYDPKGKNFPAFLLDGFLKSIPWRLYPDQGVYGVYKLDAGDWDKFVERGNVPDENDD